MGNFNSNTITLIGLSIIFAIILFMVIRGIVLWYFKIDERTRLLDEQNELLKAIFKQLGGTIDNKNNP